MSNSILDLYISEGYPYQMSVSLNDEDDIDLESNYTCWFNSSSIGTLQFTFVTDRWQLEMSSTDTAKLTDSIEEYVVYAINISSGKKRKLISGRIRVDDKVRT